MKLRFLGTGTSQGIPVIGCSCPVCISQNPKDQRFRSSVLISEGQTNIIIDVGPDFRMQMLAAGTKHLEAILITHEHNDHIAGLDDIRPFNFRAHKPMPVYALERVAKDLRNKFAYIFSPSKYPGAPSVDLMLIEDHADEFYIDGIPVKPIRFHHADLPILGFRIRDIVYITDLKSIDEAELEKIRGCKTLVLNALRMTSHYSHLSLKQAIEMAEYINPDQTYFTHISHDMGLSSLVEKELPKNMQLAFDGLEITL